MSFSLFLISMSGPEDAIFRFDYRKKAGMSGLEAGIVCNLAADSWLVDKSPYSDRDLTVNGPDPASDELDYCLVRLAERIGEARLGGSSDEKTPLRGWIKIGKEQKAGENGEHVFILQHPDSAVLKLAIGDHKGFNARGNRLLYDANTLPGSSGSPVYNADFELIGIHHRGDKRAYKLAMGPETNQGIPISNICKLMEGRGVPLA